MNAAVLAGVAALLREVIRREEGGAPDSRFDLALDVVADLSDALAPSLAQTLVTEHPELD